MYHALWAVPDDLAGADSHYAVALPRFTEQLALCQRIAGGAISARDWLSGRAGVILTFDDGHAEQSPPRVPRPAGSGRRRGFLREPGAGRNDRVRDLDGAARDGGSGNVDPVHGLDHRNYLTTLSPSRLREDLRRARLEIEEKIGQPVTLLAPAGGRAPRDLERIAQEVGYTHVFGSNPAPIGRDRRHSPRPFRRDRRRCEQRDFESLLRGGRARVRAQLRHAVLALAKRALGDGVYERTRARFTGTSVEH